MRDRHITPEELIVKLNRLAEQVNGLTDDVGKIDRTAIGIELVITQLDRWISMKQSEDLSDDYVQALIDFRALLSRSGPYSHE